MSKLIVCVPFVFVLLLSLSCQKKESDGEAEVSGVVNQEVAIEQPITSDELGFAARLPKSTEFYASVYDLKGVVKSVMPADVPEFWLTAEDVIGEKTDLEMEDLSQERFDEVVAQIDEVMVGNAFIAVEKGVATNLETAGELYQNMNAAQAKLAAKVLARLLKMEDPLLDTADPVMQEFLVDLLTGFGAVEKLMVEGESMLEMPRLYVGCQPPAGKMDEWRRVWLSAVAEMAEEQEGVEKCEFEKYGTHFQGVTLALGRLFSDAAEVGGNELQKGLEEELGDEVDDLLDEELQETLTDQGEEWLNKLSERLEKLTMMLVVGEVDGHLVMFLGENADAMVLVEQLEDSLAGKSEFSQLGQEGGTLMGAWYASEDLIQSFQVWRGYEKTYRALAEAFEQEDLPHGQKIAQKWSALGDLEHQLLDYQIDDYLMLCVQDQGVRFDSVGGRVDQDLDFTEPLKLPSVVENLQGDYVLRAHWRGNQNRQAMRMDYAELMVGVMGEVIESGYLAFLERNDEGGEWYEKGKAMYEEIVAPELARFWGGYRKLSHQALDGEVAVLMDLNGGMPRVPGVPKSYIKDGKVPRIMVARPVKDREALDSAYFDFQTTSKNVLEYTSILVETELPMPEFVSSDKGGLTTWFYPFPMMTNDFVPGVSVSDSLLMVGTSKNWAEQTYAAWENQEVSASDSEGLRGSVVEIQFKQLWDFTAQWLDLAEKEEKLRAAEDLRKEEALSQLEDEDLVQNDDELNDDEADEEEPFDFVEARKMLERARRTKSLHWHRRLEDHKMRSTLELKTGSGS